MFWVCLLFLLRLSSSACDATSRNHRLFLTTAVDVVPAPSPSTTSRHDHHTTMHVYSSHAYVHAATMMQQQQGSPSSPYVELRGAVEGVLPAEQEETAATMAPSPREDGAAGGYKEVGGGGVGGEGGSWGVGDDDQQERKVDIGIDYAPPKTHPPSHN